MINDNPSLLAQKCHEKLPAKCPFFKNGISEYMSFIPEYIFWGPISIMSSSICCWLWRSGMGAAVVRWRSRQCPGTKPCVYFLRCFLPGVVRTLKLYVDSEKGFTAIRIRMVANGCEFLEFRECEWVLMKIFKIFKP